MNQPNGNYAIHYRPDTYRVVQCFQEKGLAEVEINGERFISLNGSMATTGPFLDAIRYGGPDPRKSVKNKMKGAPL